MMCGACHVRVTRALRAPPSSSRRPTPHPSCIVSLPISLPLPVTEAPQLRDPAPLPWRPRPADRILDVLAALFLAEGALVFFHGRQALRAIADGRYVLPPGYTWVARAELHDMQTTLGMRIMAIGAVIALIAAAAHAWGARRRRRRELGR